MKTLLKAVAFGAVLVTTANAFANTNFTIRVPSSEELSSWSHADPVRLPWISVGNAFDCGSWTPGVNTITTAGSTEQARNCKINQEQEVILREKDNFSGSIKEVGRRTDDRISNQDESRTLTSTESAWTNTGDVFDCGLWSPTPSTDSIIEQNRACSQTQAKNVDVFLSGSKIHTNNQNQDIPVAENRNARGKTIIDTTECDDDSWSLSGTTCSRTTTVSKERVQVWRCPNFIRFPNYAPYYECYRVDSYRRPDYSEPCAAGWDDTGSLYCRREVIESREPTWEYHCPSGTSEVGGSCQKNESKPANIVKDEYCESGWKEESGYCVE